MILKKNKDLIFLMFILLLGNVSANLSSALEKSGSSATSGASVQAQADITIGDTFFGTTAGMYSNVEASLGELVETCSGAAATQVEHLEEIGKLLGQLIAAEYDITKAFAPGTDPLSYALSNGLMDQTQKAAGEHIIHNGTDAEKLNLVHTIRNDCVNNFKTAVGATNHHLVQDGGSIFDLSVLKGQLGALKSADGSFTPATVPNDFNFLVYPNVEPTRDEDISYDPIFGNLSTIGNIYRQDLRCTDSDASIPLQSILNHGVALYFWFDQNSANLSSDVTKVFDLKAGSDNSLVKIDIIKNADKQTQISITVGSGTPHLTNVSDCNDRTFVLIAIEEDCEDFAIKVASRSINIDQRIFIDEKIPQFDMHSIEPIKLIQTDVHADAVHRIDYFNYTPQGEQDIFAKTCDASKVNDLIQLAGKCKVKEDHCLYEADDNCLSCEAPNFLYNGKCIEQCDDGMVRVENTCAPCHMYCSKCVGTNNGECTECKYPDLNDVKYALSIASDSTNPDIGTCVPVCPTGEYMKETIVGDKTTAKCEECSVNNCGSCPGDVCEECGKDENGKQTYKLIVEGAVTCVTDCGLKKYANPNSKECEDCNVSGCDVCDADHNDCTECEDGKFYYKEKIVNGETVTYEKKCGTCPSGTFPETISSETGLTGGVCSPCTDTGCAECSNNDSCTICKDGYKKNAAGFCDPICEDGHGLMATAAGATNVEKECVICKTENCKKCAADYANCEECYKKDEMPPKRNDTTEVSPLTEDLYLEVGNPDKCVPECSEGSYEGEFNNIDTCMPCDDSNIYCGNCEGPTDCTECKDGKHFYYVKKVNGEDVRTNDPTGATLVCIPNCSELQPELEISANHHGQCIFCEDPNCHKCSHNTNNICEECKDGFYMDDETGECIPQCASNEYQDEQNKKCLPCEQPCATCGAPESDSATQGVCINCGPDHVFYVDKCYPDCKSTTLGLPDTAVTHHPEVNVNRNIDSSRPETEKICVPCDLNKCQVCKEVVTGDQTSMECEVCKDGHYFYGDICVECTGEGKYIDESVTPAQCKDCTTSLNCKECEADSSSENGNKCTSCTAPAFLNNGKCIESCEAEYGTQTPPREIRFGDDCFECTHNCKVCSTVILEIIHPETPRFRCLECENNTYLHEGKCVSECPESGLYEGKDDEGKPVCLECEEGCFMCSAVDGSEVDGKNTKSTCDICKAGLMLTPGNEPECKNNCGDGKVEVQSNACFEMCRNKHPEISRDSEEFKACLSECGKDCIDCQNGYNCKTCVPTDLDECTSCPVDHPLKQEVKDPVGTKCVSECESGYIASTDGKECLPCDTNCSACNPSPDYCTACDGTHVLQPVTEGQDCKPVCDIGYVNIDGQCTLCTEDSNCKRCDTTDLGKCTECNGTNVISDDKCIIECPSGTMPVGEDGETKKCESCNFTGCDKCITQGTCNQCKLGKKKILDSNGKIIKCVDDCEAASPINSIFYVEKVGEDKCVPCTVDGCKKCSPTQTNKCTECKDPLALSLPGKDACVVCPHKGDKNMLIKNNIKECHDCASDCAICSTTNNETSTCDICHSPKVLVGGSCTDNCPIEMVKVENEPTTVVDTVTEIETPVGIHKDCVDCETPDGKCDYCKKTDKDNCDFCPIDQFMKKVQNPDGSLTYSCVPTCDENNGKFITTESAQNTHLIGTPERERKFCNDCKTGCSKCNNLDTCTDCTDESHSLFTYIDNNNKTITICVGDCGEGKYRDTTDGQCKSCSVGMCESCEDGTNICQDCQSPYSIKVVNETTHLCVKCGEGDYFDHYESNGSCIPCEDNCAKCNNGTDCIRCDNPFALKDNDCNSCNTPNVFPKCTGCDSSEHTTCEHCPEGKKIMTCQDCSDEHDVLLSTCSECTSDKCTKCTNGKVPKEVIINSKIEFTCGDCPAGTYETAHPVNTGEKICKTCTDKCNICQENTDLTYGECTECEDGAYLDPVTKKCVTPCSGDNPVGVIENGHGVCKPCTAEHCATCKAGEPEKCEVCEDFKILDSNDQCTICADDAGFHLVKKTGGESECHECPNDCKKCEFQGEGDNKALVCTECENDTYLKDGICVEECLDGYNQNPNASPRECKACLITNCSDCNTSVSDCEVCKLEELEDLSPEDLSECIPNCPIDDGFYIEIGTYKCKECGTGCKKCGKTEGATEPQCTDCRPGFELWNGECLSNCPDGKIRKESDGTCEDCGVDHCKTCATKPTCAICEDNKKLFKVRTGSGSSVVEQDKCLDSCSELNTDTRGYFEVEERVQPNNTVIKVCKPCLAGCIHCQNQDTCQVCNSTTSLLKPSNDECIPDCSERDDYREDTATVGTLGTTKICEPCVDSKDCKKCADSKDTCSACEHPKYLHQGACIDLCPIGTAPIVNVAPINNRCQTCDTTTCLLCPEQSGSCEVCTPTNFVNEQTSECESCPVSNGTHYITTEELSYAHGDDTHTFQKDSCNECSSHNCEKCNNADGTLKCTKCKPTFILVNHECVPCPTSNGYFIEAITNECKPCTTDNCNNCPNDSCQECGQIEKEGGSLVDLLLHAGSGSNGEDECKESCNPGEYQQQISENPDKFECISCTAANCGVCPENKCQVCTDNLFLHLFNNIPICKDEPCKLQDGEYMKTITVFPMPPNWETTKQICAPCSLALCGTCPDDVCTECKAPKQMIDGKCLDVCGEGEIRGADDLCKPCSENCATCKWVNEETKTGDTICEECKDEPMDYLLKNGECVDDCGEEYYPLAGKCNPCSDDCKQCTGDDNCSECKTGYLIDVVSGVGTHCEPNCENHTDTFPETESGIKKCEECSDEIASCKKCAEVSGELKCNECEHGKALYNNECVVCTEKDSHLFETTVDGVKVCKPCNDSCATCNTSATHCTSCEAPKTLHNHKCVQCEDTSMYTDVDEHGHRTCKKCPALCEKCTGKDVCTKCAFDKYMESNPDFETDLPVPPRLIITSDIINQILLDNPFTSEDSLLADMKRCLPYCPESDTYYYPTPADIAGNSDLANLDYGECKTCNSNCATCADGNSCIICADGYKKNAETGVCEEICSSGEYLPAGETECKPCGNTSCAGCENSDRTECTSCTSPKFLYEGNCIPNCDGLANGPFTKYVIGTHADGSNKYSCKTCDNNCSSCSETNSCIACKDGFHFNQQGKCVDCSEEPNSVVVPVENGSICKPCDVDDCDQCVEGNDKKCKTCEEPFFLVIIGQNRPFEIDSEIYTNDTCAPSCPDGYMEVVEDNVRKCKTCPVNCETCNNEDVTIDVNKCDICKDPFIKNNAGICSMTCDEGHYRDVIEKKCKPCGSNCKDCGSSNNTTNPGTPNCEVCETNYPIKQGPNCTDQCGDKEYRDGDQCKPCGDSCKTCTKDGCTECEEPKPFNQQGECVPQCTGEYFSPDPINNKDCEQCPFPNCDGCDATKCHGCKVGSFIKDGKCVKSCGLGFYPDHETHECKPCSSGCAICKDGTQCHFCKRNFFLSEQDKTCKDHCLSGFAPKPVERLCMPCLTDDSCEKCDSETLEKCIKCNPDKLKQGDKCVSKCDDGYFRDVFRNICAPCDHNCRNCKQKEDDGTQICLECAPGYTQTPEGRCKSECPSNYASDNGVCVKCFDANCAECNTNSTKCVTCADPYVLLEGTCVNTISCPADKTKDECDNQICGDGYFIKKGTFSDTIDGQTVVSNSYKCTPCGSSQDNCATCMVGEGDNVVCTSCENGTFLNANNQCVDTCEGSFFGDCETGKCVSCDESCETCNDSDEESCLTCKTDGDVKFYRDIHRCLPATECPEGKYANDANGTCDFCIVPGCKSCPGDICNACQSGYKLINGLCTKEDKYEQIIGHPYVCSSETVTVHTYPNHREPMTDMRSTYKIVSVTSWIRQLEPVLATGTGAPIFSIVNGQYSVALMIKNGNAGEQECYIKSANGNGQTNSTSVNCNFDLLRKYTFFNVSIELLENKQVSCSLSINGIDSTFEPAIQVSGSLPYGADAVFNADSKIIFNHELNSPGPFEISKFYIHDYLLKMDKCAVFFADLPYDKCDYYCDTCGIEGCTNCANGDIVDQWRCPAGGFRYFDDLQQNEAAYTIKNDPRVTHDWSSDKYEINFYYFVETEGAVTNIQSTGTDASKVIDITCSSAGLLINGTATQITAFETGKWYHISVGYTFTSILYEVRDIFGVSIIEANRGDNATFLSMPNMKDLRAFVNMEVSIEHATAGAFIYRLYYLINNVAKYDEFKSLQIPPKCQNLDKNFNCDACDEGFKLNATFRCVEQVEGPTPEYTNLNIYTSITAGTRTIKNPADTPENQNFTISFWMRKINASIRTSTTTFYSILGIDYNDPQTDVTLIEGYNQAEDNGEQTFMTTIGRPNVGENGTRTYDPSIEIDHSKDYQFGDYSVWLRFIITVEERKTVTVHTFNGGTENMTFIYTIPDNLKSSFSGFILGSMKEQTLVQYVKIHRYALILSDTDYNKENSPVIPDGACLDYGVFDGKCGLCINERIYNNNGVNRHTTCPSYFFGYKNAFNSHDNIEGDFLSFYSLFDDLHVSEHMVSQKYSVSGFFQILSNEPKHTTAAGTYTLFRIKNNTSVSPVPSTVDSLISIEVEITSTKDAHDRDVTSEEYNLFLVYNQGIQTVRQALTISNVPFKNKDLIFVSIGVDVRERQIICHIENRESMQSNTVELTKDNSLSFYPEPLTREGVFSIFPANEDGAVVKGLITNMYMSLNSAYNETERDSFLEVARSVNPENCRLSSIDKYKDTVCHICDDTQNLINGACETRPAHSPERVIMTEDPVSVDGEAGAENVILIPETHVSIIRYISFYFRIFSAAETAKFAKFGDISFKLKENDTHAAEVEISGEKQTLHCAGACENVHVLIDMTGTNILIKTRTPSNPTYTTSLTFEKHRNNVFNSAKNDVSLTTAYNQVEIYGAELLKEMGSGPSFQFADLACPANFVFCHRNLGIITGFGSDNTMNNENIIAPVFTQASIGDAWEIALKDFVPEMGTILTNKFQIAFELNLPEISDNVSNSYTLVALYNIYNNQKTIVPLSVSYNSGLHRFTLRATNDTLAKHNMSVSEHIRFQDRTIRNFFIRVYSEGNSVTMKILTREGTESKTVDFDNDNFYLTKTTFLKSMLKDSDSSQIYGTINNLIFDYSNSLGNYYNEDAIVRRNLINGCPIGTHPQGDACLEDSHVAIAKFTDLQPFNYHVNAASSSHSVTSFGQTISATNLGQFYITTWFRAESYYLDAQNPVPVLTISMDQSFNKKLLQLAYANSQMHVIVGNQDTNAWTSASSDDFSARWIYVKATFNNNSKLLTVNMENMSINSNLLEESTQSGFNEVTLQGVGTPHLIVGEGPNSIPAQFFLYNSIAGFGVPTAALDNQIPSPINRSCAVRRTDNGVCATEVSHSFNSSETGYAKLGNVLGVSTGDIWAPSWTISFSLNQVSGQEKVAIFSVGGSQSYDVLTGADNVNHVLTQEGNLGLIVDPVQKTINMVVGTGTSEVVAAYHSTASSYKFNIAYDAIRKVISFYIEMDGLSGVKVKRDIVLRPLHTNSLVWTSQLTNNFKIHTNGITSTDAYKKIQNDASFCQTYQPNATRCELVDNTDGVIALECASGYVPIDGYCYERISDLPEA